MPIVMESGTTLPAKLAVTTPLTPDIYDILEFTGEIQKEYTGGVEDDTLMLGIFGYMREMFSQMTQNTIVMASEFANEGIPTRAKFEKNVIAHAIGLGITAINATPAEMEVHLTFIEDEIIEALGGGSGEFKFDCDNEIYFGDFEFHPDYDIIIKRVRLANGTFTYTAMYDMVGDGIYENPVSNITNPYLNPPVVIAINNTRYLMVTCTIRQVTKTTIHGKVLSDNVISSKTFNFKFEGQLAAFDVNVVNNTGLVHLSPVYEGLSSSGTKYDYVWFTYLESDQIRIKFDRESYYPRINSDVEIRLQTTTGQSGNFNWSEDEPAPMFFFDSKKNRYSNICVEVKPVTFESLYGINKKSVKELKQIIPKEALSRGSVTNTTDLQNYFNAIDSEASKMYFYKRRDNCMERLYYSFILMKDARANIIPTNTTMVEVTVEDMETIPGSGKFILKRGQVLKLTPDGTRCRIYNPGNEPDFKDSFYYIVPYNFAINIDPMYGMYFLTTMNVRKSLFFAHINEECQFQYISTFIKWNRKYTIEPDTYVMQFRLLQNITGDISMFEFNPETGELISANVKAYVVFYMKNSPYRYAEGTIISFDPATSELLFEFRFKSNDLMDENNRIRIEGVTMTGYAPEDSVDYGYLSDNTKAMIHIVTYQPEFSKDTKYQDSVNRSKEDLRRIIPTIPENWCVSNSYEVNSGVDFFYNYSEIIYSNVQLVQHDGSKLTIGDDLQIKFISIRHNDEYFAFTLTGDPIYESDVMYGRVDSFMTTYNGKEFKFTIASGGVGMFPRYTTTVGDQVLEYQYAPLVTDEVIKNPNDPDPKVDGIVLKIEGHKMQFDITGESIFQSDLAKGRIESFTAQCDGLNYTFVNVSNIANPQIPTYYVEINGITYYLDYAAYKNIEPDNTPIKEFTIEFENQEITFSIVNDNVYKSDLKYGRISEFTAMLPDGTEVVFQGKNIDPVLSIPMYKFVVDGQDIIFSYVPPKETSLTEPNSNYYFRILNVPLIKSTYFDSEDKVEFFCNELIRRKAYIDRALENIEDSFGMDFKFFNTYGPSRMYTLDGNVKCLNRVNISIKFRLGLRVSYNKNIFQAIMDDIKAYIEDIQNINSIHMSNLVSDITEKYAESLSFFEFVDFNGYGPGTQHLYAMTMPEGVITPEFININTLEDKDYTPDITLVIA